MQKKANILFFTLTLMLIILIVTLIMSTLFHVQTETLVIAKEGSNAFSAAQAGVEATRNSFPGKLTAAACDGTRRPGTITASFVTYGTAADTRYDVSYWFICTGAGTAASPFILHSYEITSTGTFRGTVRTSVVRGSWGQYIARWDMNEGRGTMAWDRTRNNNHGTLNNFVAPHGWVDGAISFDGTNDWVGLPEPPAASTNIGTGSVFAWIKTTGAGTGHRGIVVKQSAYGMFLLDNIFVIHDWGPGGGDRSSLTNVATGTWRHVGFTFQSGVTNGTILYIDGAPALTTTMTVANQLEGVVMGAGNNPGTIQFFTGLIDEVSIYNRVLTAEEVLASFNRRR